MWALWGAGVVGIVVLLSRSGCEARALGERATLRRAPKEGWIVRFNLPGRHPLTPLIAGQLLARGRPAETTEEIGLDGPDDGLARRLRAAGWVVLPAETGREPCVEIFAPDRTLRWTGGFRGPDLMVTGAVMLDGVVLDEVARGEAGPPYVPVGCATRPSREERVAESGGIRKFFNL